MIFKKRRHFLACLKDWLYVWVVRKNSEREAVSVFNEYKFVDLPPELNRIMPKTP